MSDRNSRFAHITQAHCVNGYFQYGFEGKLFSQNCDTGLMYCLLSAEPATPLPPIGVDVRLAVPPSLENELEEGVRKPRPRPTGKLLAAVPHEGGVVGLALLRLEHLDSVERGELNLTVGNEDGANWTICHRWPEWFPKKGVDEVPSEDD